MNTTAKATATATEAPPPILAAAEAANNTLGSGDVNPVCESIADYKIRPGDSLKEAQIKQGDLNVVEQEKLMPGGCPLPRNVTQSMCIATDFPCFSPSPSSPELL